MHIGASVVHSIVFLANCRKVMMCASTRIVDKGATPWVAVESDPAAAIGCVADAVTERAGTDATGRAVDSIAAAKREATKRVTVEALRSVMLEGERWKIERRWQVHSASATKQVD